MEARNNRLPQQEEEDRDREAEYHRAAEYHEARLRLETREARNNRLDREDRRRREIIREGGRRNFDGRRINDDESMLALEKEMEEDKVIEVYQEQDGGGL